MTTTAHRQAVETRRLYRFEAVFLHPLRKPWLNRPRALGYLRRLAVEVWAKHGRQGLGTPSVKVVDGVTSTCEGYSKIELASNRNTPHNIPHNTVEVLLHELVHAIGYPDHGKGFVRKYRELLVEYGACVEGELVLGMGLMKLKS